MVEQEQIRRIVMQALAEADHIKFMAAQVAQLNLYRYGWLDLDNIEAIRRHGESYVNR